MIFAIAEGLRAGLAGLEFPCSVSIGHDRASLGSSRHHVTIDRDRTATETIEGAVGSKQNPKRVRSRYPWYTIRVSAMSPEAGALQWENDTDCDKLVDGVIAVLVAWGCAQGAIIGAMSGRVLAPAEYGYADVAPYSCYELSVSIGRSVERRHYDGSGEDTATVAAVETTTEARVEINAYKEI